LPLAEVSMDLDPPAPERIDHAAWQIARAARCRGAIYRSDFDGRERPRTAEIAHQSDEEMLREAAKIEDAWPHKAEVQHETTLSTEYLP
jgi:hypothetical protein